MQNFSFVYHIPLNHITDSRLKLCYLNAKSVHKHIQDLRKDLNYSSSDINILAETRFNSQDPNDMYDISGYNLLQNDYLNSSNGLVRPYGGTAVYSKIPYLPRYPHCHNIHGIEITVIKVMTHENWTILGKRVYHSLKVSVRQFCEAILNAILLDNSIIVGEFNRNWLIETERRPLFNLQLRDKGYKQLISTYTTDNKTAIDHIYTNISQLDFQASVLEKCFTENRVV